MTPGTISSLVIFDNALAGASRLMILTPSPEGGITGDSKNGRIINLPGFPGHCCRYIGNFLYHLPVNYYGS